MSKRTDLSLAEKIALLDNESHAVSLRPVVCAVKGTGQRVLECLHVSCSVLFQDESVLAQLGLGAKGGRCLQDGGSRNVDGDCLLRENARRRTIVAFV